MNALPCAISMSPTSIVTLGVREDQTLEQHDLHKKHKTLHICTGAEDSEHISSGFF